MLYTLPTYSNYPGALYTSYLIVGLGSDYPAGQYHVCGSSSLLGLRSSEDIVTIVQACRLEQLLQQWMLTINRDSVTRFFFLHDSCPTYICCSIFAHGLHFVEKFTCSKKNVVKGTAESKLAVNIFFISGFRYHKKDFAFSKDTVVRWLKK